MARRLRATVVAIATLSALAVCGQPRRAAACDHPLPVYEAGRVTRRVCEPAAREEGLTIVDLSDGWTPYVLSDDPTMGEDGVQAYGPIFRALADERLADVAPEHYPEPHLELFGIPPTLRLLAERLGEDERHACHAAIDDTALLALDRVVRPRGRDLERQQARVRELALLTRRLERVAERRGLDSIEELADDERHGRTLERRRRVFARVQAIGALQAHLICDGLLSGRYERGVFDHPTAAATEQFHRRRMVLSGSLLTSGTRRAIGDSSLEADFHALLRVLRERVASATGLVEDGSAGRAWGTILGRVIDPPELRADGGQPAAPNPAPDLLSPATEALARALGLTDPGSARAALTRIESQRVAVRLPSLPRYHASEMVLRAEIDRGDVRYDYPFTADGRRRYQHVARRPMLTLYARDGAEWKALIRWPTTIGGWNDEQMAWGATALRYKESPVGRRVWRQIVASPSWIPPPATPDDELARRSRRGLAPRYDVLGPSYRSAYGLVMLVHERPLNPIDGVPRYFDEAIRTHGSVAYRSILRGTSHGCHRLHNPLALRLASFVLTHRAHRRVGRIPVRYSRVLRVGGQSARIAMSSRGYGFELVEPVPMVVLRGRVVGRRRTPIASPPSPVVASPEGQGIGGAP